MTVGAKESSPSTEKIIAGIRIEVDVLEITCFEDLLQRRKKSSLKKVFTDEEIKQSENNLEILTGKLAAKKAVAKAIGVDFDSIKRIDVEIIIGEKGEPTLHLYNAAQDYSDELDISDWAISISHTKNIAVAVAVAAKSDNHPTIDSLSKATDIAIMQITEKIGKVEADRRD